LFWVFFSSSSLEVFGDESSYVIIPVLKYEIYIFVHFCPDPPVLTDLHSNHWFTMSIISIRTGVRGSRIQQSSLFDFFWKSLPWVILFSKCYL
jgi:hypothetical protein